MKKKDKLLNIYLNKKEKKKRRERLLDELKEYIVLEKPAIKPTESKSLKYKRMKLSKLNKECALVDSLDFNECKSIKKISNIDKHKITEKEEPKDGTIRSKNEECIHIEKEKMKDKSILDDLNCKSSLLMPKEDMNIHESNKLDVQKHFVKRKDSIEHERLKLPIYYEEMNIMDAINANDVVFISGETGSGKSTQIPQFIYENISIKDMIIGMTQPRRISATSLSKRINLELDKNICSYKIRYEDTTTNHTKIKIMTEGVLMNEIKTDVMLTKYSHIILDEIHEQSAISEIIIIMLSRIIKFRRQNGVPLKLIMMSATHDIDKMNSIFGFNIYKVDIEKQSYKVNILYEKETNEHYYDLVLTKIKLILNSGRKEPHINDETKTNTLKLPINVINDKSASILIFLPGKKEIYDIINLINEQKLDLDPIPLHSMLPFTQQNRIYEKSDKRKVILATNIAETSITVPDVVFVIDSGRRKYKVCDSTGLVSFITLFTSKSSAIQRSGRAGRVSDGVCFRLYSGEFYSSLKNHESPEILNISLENITLMLKSLGIENISAFPFINNPGKEAIEKSLQFLNDLGAIENKTLTSIGENMIQFPIDVRFSRLLTIKTNLEDELAMIVSILSLDFDNLIDILFYNKSHKSEIIAKMCLMINYINAEDREEFISKHKLSKFQINEIFKLFRYIRKIRKQDIKFKFDDITEEKILLLRKYIYGVFCYNFVDKIGNDFYYKDKKVIISNLNKFSNCTKFVFTHIEAFKENFYLKNVTCVDDII